MTDHLEKPDYGESYSHPIINNNKVNFCKDKQCTADYGNEKACKYFTSRNQAPNICVSRIWAGQCMSPMALIK